MQWFYMNEAVVYLNIEVDCFLEGDHLRALCCCLFQRTMRCKKKKSILVKVIKSVKFNQNGCIVLLFVEKKNILYFWHFWAIEPNKHFYFYHKYSFTQAPVLLIVYRRQKAFATYVLHPAPLRWTQRRMNFKLKQGLTKSFRNVLLLLNLHSPILPSQSVTFVWREPTNFHKNLLFAPPFRSKGPWNKIIWKIQLGLRNCSAFRLYQPLKKKVQSLLKYFWFELPSAFMLLRHSLPLHEKETPRPTTNSRHWMERSM